MLEDEVSTAVHVGLGQPLEFKEYAWEGLVPERKVATTVEPYFEASLAVTLSYPEGKAAEEALVEPILALKIRRLLRVAPTSIWSINPYLHTFA